jgi:hypothetical protein
MAKRRSTPRRVGYPEIRKALRRESDLDEKFTRRAGGRPRRRR